MKPIFLLLDFSFCFNTVQYLRALYNTAGTVICGELWGVSVEGGNRNRIGRINSSQVYRVKFFSHSNHNV